MQTKHETTLFPRQAKTFYSYLKSRHEHLPCILNTILECGPICCICTQRNKRGKILRMHLKIDLCTQNITHHATRYSDSLAGYTIKPKD